MSGEWKWRPEAGRWRLLEHGFPDTPHNVSISTRNVSRRESYDYWRGLAFTDFEPDSPAGEEKTAFRASATGLCWNRADFFLTDSGAVSGTRGARHFERDGLDSLSIGIVLNGRRRSEQDGDEQVLVGPGGLFVYDAARPGRITWSRHKAAYLVVRRAEAQAVLGEPPVASQIMRRLRLSPLRHVLSDQFRMLARHMTFLSSDEQAYLLDQTVQLALFALGNSPVEHREQSPKRALVYAALRFIENNLSDPKLDAVRVANAVNCSRATLYRAFGEAGSGVAEAIRDVRLDRARALIEQMPAGQSIGSLAVSCGLYDTANFSRQFRMRFGVPPSALRPPTDRR